MAAAYPPSILDKEPDISKPRVFMISDILNEPDDEMSLVRFLLYSNYFDVQGICACTSASLRHSTHPEAMERIIHAYGKVVDNLNEHVASKHPFPDPKKLLDVVSSGPKVYGRKFMEEPTISEGAKRLIHCLEQSKEPLYVGLWGGANTVAQALHHIEQTRSKNESKELRSRLRVYSISDQDDAGLWIRLNWPDTFYITSSHGFGEFIAATWTGINCSDNGVTDTTKVNDEWLSPNIRIGPLGAEYPLIKFGMEGDSPSFMWLIPNGLSDGEHPEWGSWGGRYQRITWSYDLSSEYGVSPDTVVTPNGKPYTSVQATVWRWRDAFQDDFAARMQWTQQSFDEAAHPPIVNINGSVGPEPLYLEIPCQHSMVLDASATIDVDHPEDISQLDFEWFFYLESSCPHETGVERYSDFLPIVSLSPQAKPVGKGIINEAGFKNFTTGPKVSVTNMVPDRPVEAPNWPEEWHVVLQVKTKKGAYPIRRYKRVIIRSIDTEVRN